MADKGKWIGHLAVAGAYIIFGFNIIFCKDIANAKAVTPEVLFALRAIGACILFWAISLFLPKERVEGRDIWKIAIASFIGLFVPQYSFLQAITMTMSIDTAILGTLAPIFTMFFAAIFLKEPITFKKAGGVALSFAGVLLLIFNSVHSGNGVDHTEPLGIVLMLVNSISFALYLGIFRPLISKYSVVTFMKWMFLFSMLLSLPMSWHGLISTDYAAIKPAIALEIAFVIVFATFIAYFLIPVGQKKLRPTIVGMYTYLQPVITAAVSICIGMDYLSWQKLLATVLIFVGVAFVSRSRAAHA